MNDVARPEFLAYRPWLIAWALLMLASAAQMALAQRRQIHASMIRRFGPAFSLPRAALKLALWTAGAWFLLLALATPLGAPVKVEGESQGADIVLAVDVSSSMYAQDIGPNRLLALKRALQDFLGRLEGDRVGIVAFAGEAVIACPLTSDYETVSLFLDKLESDSVPSDGTGLATAIRLCLDGFAADPKRGRLVVLASDGEDTLDTKTEAEARRAGELGVPIYTLGVGTPGGAMIPGRPDIFGRVMAKLYKGQPIITRLNPATLRSIAELSGGRYFAGASPAALAAAYASVRQLKQSAAKSAERYVREPLFQQPLLWAILLLLGEAMLSNRSGGLRSFWSARWKALRRRWEASRATAAAALLLLALAGRAGAFSLDPGRAEYDEGNAAYRGGAYDKAEEAYGRSLAGKDRGAAHYNLGNARFQQGNFDGAIEAYEQALSLDPNDEDAKHNLELAKRRKEQAKDGKGKGGKQDGKKQGQQDGQNQGGQGQNQGQNQGSQKGQQGGQQNGQGGKPQPGQAGNLSQDQIQAMMNMLKNDQNRYKGAFNPLQKRQNQDQNQDPFDQMFQEMTGRPRQPQQGQGSGDRKDW